MKVTVFGVGYVGLVQGAVLADVGHDVLCVDVDAEKIEGLKDGRIPIYEPGLESLVRENYSARRLDFTNDPFLGVRHGEVLIIAVGTPPDEDGSADLKYVLSVAETISLGISSYKVIVNKSTVPVGTADKVHACILQGISSRRAAGIEFDVVSNPEFLKEGAAIADCMRPDRIVIGVASPRAEKVMRDLYAPFNRNHEKIISMDVRSAELTKYAANCMLAAKISFINEVSVLSERLGADIEKVRQGIGSDPRIGYQFIYAGAGYGGSCFPKDVSALIRTASELGFDAQFLKSIEWRNEQQKKILFEKIFAHFCGDLEGKIFAVWGLSFKPNTDDMREAPSRVLIDSLLNVGAKVRAYDPVAMDEARKIYSEHDGLEFVEAKESALVGADALVIVTEWQEFKAPDFEILKKCLNSPVVFDGRNLFEPAQMLQRGIVYYSIGRAV
ncbi:UDP-glucose dehydrogenase family protein [Ectopseudomonas toyotomiensis]|uniref:UDP-glucose 6-dehydrogenase n=1 Tax=Ectopseudomonas toyotomiensis TaxID=554344 RepID=A0AA42IPI1_9GAMM|nr:UDP-glucose/GDP-mannose dehydrogenase family protein [Pseudomonas toyotomiensis]MBG0843046.1 UDP-glucose/GDP-mannose dehydrogenase family protein [Pseudomonas toyotomiensis]MDH0703149.1 UDP-glucose/GDP-mannose dehydrogenase family protein [Pseudomonas toyotomiensis]